MGSRGRSSARTGNPTGVSRGTQESAEQVEAKVQQGYVDKFNEVARRAEAVHANTDQTQETADRDFADYNKGKGKAGEHLANLRSARDHVNGKLSGLRDAFTQAGIDPRNGKGGVIRGAGASANNRAYRAISRIEGTRDRIEGYIRQMTRAGVR